MRTHISSATTSIPTAINPLLQLSALPLAVGAAQQLLTLAATSILAAINPLLRSSALSLAAGAAQQLLALAAARIPAAINPFLQSSHLLPSCCKYPNHNLLSLKSIIFSIKPHQA
ncbi:hypothetical protein Pyn_23059 [Prunus yedoensis var. nudiflora]|uniref:Uncharacterized protein n=1 Tax=Prunus yedoensis var. nudiflora TaxID=2094558 RepID=A0A314UG95_PRUYE|nr:hypothetical protein Pyn_23059 [Prunus yedoensis var. nudiflora]